MAIGWTAARSGVVAPSIVIDPPVEASPFMSSIETLPERVTV